MKKYGTGRLSEFKKGDKIALLTSKYAVRQFLPPSKWNNLGRP
jgi:hypothetical protein